MKPGGPSRALDLLGVRRAALRAQGIGELDLVDAVVAAHEHEHEPSRRRRRDHREGLQQGTLREPELARDLRDRGQARGGDGAPGAGGARGSSTGCGSALATSTFAA